MIFAIFIGILSALVVLIAMARMDIRKFMGYPATMDILVTVLLIAMLHGSYVGMVAAVIGGLVFSALITVIRKTYGYKRLHRVKMKLVWVAYNPTTEFHFKFMPKIRGWQIAGAVCLLIAMVS